MGQLTLAGATRLASVSRPVARPFEAADAAPGAVVAGSRSSCSGAWARRRVLLRRWRAGCSSHSCEG
jgi:hypothetical protein